jgi:hypothetical protein
LGVYADGSLHCFSCGYHKLPNFRDELNRLIASTDTKDNNNEREKALLPLDFTREVPTDGWKWLLQYGLPYSYWKTRCGFTEKERRIVFPIGSPTRFSLGRSLSVGGSKWKVYGDKSSYVEVIGEQLLGEFILVEDIISANKTGVAGFTTIPLFGTTITDLVVKKLQGFKRPVALWLDDDQYGLLPKKIGRLQALLNQSVRHIRTNKDPKEYSALEIKEILT